jgi:hypothetical protein
MGYQERRWERDIGEGPHGSQSRVGVLVILYISPRHANVEQLFLFNWHMNDERLLSWS